MWLNGTDVKTPLNIVLRSDPKIDINPVGEDEIDIYEAKIVPISCPFINWKPVTIPLFPDWNIYDKSRPELEMYPVKDIIILKHLIIMYLT